MLAPFLLLQKVNVFVNGRSAQITNSCQFADVEVSALVGGVVSEKSRRKAICGRPICFPFALAIATPDRNSFGHGLWEEIGIRTQYPPPMLPPQSHITFHKIPPPFLYTFLFFPSPSCVFSAFPIQYQQEHSRTRRASRTILMRNHFSSQKKFTTCTEKEVLL